MIIDMVRGDVFQTDCKHIVFAVNAEGFNDAGFAGQVSRRHWPELANTGGKRLGEVLRKEVGDKKFHAIVCHELGGSGWIQTPNLVRRCLNILDVPEDEEIAIVLMGNGMVGQIGGADVFAIMAAMASSQKKVVIYTL